MQVGVHDEDDRVCQLEGCTEIDLLPARCSDCQKTFCSQHIFGSSHHCEAKKNAVVASCPLCARVVPLEFPGQNIDEAVSRHMDRGCKDVPQVIGNAGSHAAPVGGIARAMLATNDFAGGTAGRRLGGAMPAQNTCSYGPCGRKEEVRIVCDLCGLVYCVEHRTPAKHACPKQRSTPPPVISSKEANGTGGGAISSSPAAKPGALRSDRTAASISDLLSTPSNTKGTAAGKKTELAEDMVTPLICLLAPSSSAAKYVPVPPFFMHLSKQLVLGRVVDLAINEVSKYTSAVKADVAWRVHVVPLPVPSGATAAMYPAVALSTTVGESPLVSRPDSVVVISTSSTLPEEALLALKSAKSKTKSSSSGKAHRSSSCSGDDCHLM